MDGARCTEHTHPFIPGWVRVVDDVSEDVLDSARDDASVVTLHLTLLHRGEGGAG